MVQPTPEPTVARVAAGQACDLEDGPDCLAPAVCVNDGGSSSSGTCKNPDPQLCASVKVPKNPGPPAGAFVSAPHDTTFYVPSKSGIVLANPELVTITWDNYPYRAQADAYGDWIVNSDWLTAVGEEYGVHHGTNRNVHIAGASPKGLSDLGLQQLLAGWQGNGTIPSPGPNTLYMVWLRDADTHVGDNYGGGSCTSFEGYHSEALMPHFVYAIVVGCGPVAQYSELEDSEATASHELIEAATDPYFITAPAYILSGVFAYFGEIGDLCQGRTDHEGDFSYQRIWSNQAAHAGGDPCVPPNPNEPYFRVEITPQQVTSLVISQVTELTFTAWSTAPIGRLQVAVEYLGGPFVPFVSNPYNNDDDAALGFGTPTSLPDAPMLTNGESGHLSFTLPASARNGEQAGMLVVARSSETVYTAWPFVIRAKAP
jgi:hypothetical protein